MQRREFIERHIRQIYGGFPTDDAQITDNLVNSWLSDATAYAAKLCYNESIKLDGVAYINNSFYSTFSDLTITRDGNINLGYQLTLPEVPPGVGRNEGISTLQLKDDNGFVSLPVVWLNINQVAYADVMPPIINKILAWSEGKQLKMKSVLTLSEYTGIVRMISAGDRTDLDSELNVPQDYYPYMVEYVQKQLMLMKGIRQDTNNEGNDTKL
jgi:hypothetical protein